MKTSNTKFWINLANYWRKLNPPFRPSQEDIRNYEKFLKQVSKSKKHLKILILGATPELRDLAHKFKAEVTSVDISLDMILAMTELVKDKKKTEEEIWVKANWLTMPLARGYWDVVLGDDPIGNVQFSCHSNLIRIVAELLKPKGYFIVRHFNLLPNQTKNINKVLKQLRGLRYKPKTPEEIYVLLGYTTFNSKSWAVRDPYNKLQKYWRDGQYEFHNTYLNKIVNQMYKKIPPSQKVWWHTSSQVAENLFKKYFQIIECRYPSRRTYPTLSEALPIYLLKKK